MRKRRTLSAKIKTPKVKTTRNKLERVLKQLGKKVLIGDISRKNFQQTGWKNSARKSVFFQREVVVSYILERAPRSNMDKSGCWKKQSGLWSVCA